MLARPLTLAVGAAAAALALAAPAAVAAPTFTVVAGTTTAGTSTLTATSVGAIVLTDVTKGLTVSCATGTAQGGVKLGKALPGTGLATVTNLTATSCSSPFGGSFSTSQSGTWTFDATGPTVAGVTPGVIRGVETTPTSGGLCSFKVSGTIKARLTTTATAQRLDLKPQATMTVSNVIGCFGQVSNGDKVSAKAQLKLKVAAGRLIVKSP